MASYSYQSFSSGGGADSAFQQADSNSDGRVDLNEFRNFLGQNLGGAGFSSGGSSFESASFGAGAGFGAGGSSFESSSFESSGAGFGGASYDASFGAGAGAGFGAGGSSFESYSSSAGFGADAGAVSTSVVDSSAATTNVVSQYATTAQGFYKDPNPQIIRRPAAGGVQTYTQNIKVRFLQPPPVPPPGPLIIKEVRPPQPPPPPPLRIRQQAPPLPTPPPLVLREKPPVPPAAVASQTVIRRLAALPVPPRSVIIERLPPLPPKPRDIIIERWVPYGAQAKRKTIVQRAAAAKAYAAPRNVIIQYEPVQVRVVRQFQRLGVTQENPQAYVQRYGVQLLDGTTLVQQARAAGVVEDISAPAAAASAASAAVGFGAASYGQEASFGGASSGSASFESASFSSGASGFEGGFGAGFGAGAGFGGSSFESSSFSSGFGGAESAFAQADSNGDGSLDINEFNSYLKQVIGSATGYTFVSSSSSSFTA